MAVNMKGKSLASLYDLTREEMEQIFKTSELLKLQIPEGAGASPVKREDAGA